MGDGFHIDATDFRLEDDLGWLCMMVYIYELRGLFVDFAIDKTIFLRE